MPFIRVPFQFDPQSSLLVRICSIQLMAISLSAECSLRKLSYSKDIGCDGGIQSACGRAERRQQRVTAAALPFSQTRPAGLTALQ